MVTVENGGLVDMLHDSFIFQRDENMKILLLLNKLFACPFMQNSNDSYNVKDMIKCKTVTFIIKVIILKKNGHNLDKSNGLFLQRYKNVGFAIIIISVTFPSL
jgi:hypothetical protein